MRSKRAAMHSPAPKHATPEKGQAIVDVVVGYMVPYLRRFEDHGLDFHPEDEPEP